MICIRMGEIKAPPGVAARVPLLLKVLDGVVHLVAVDLVGAGGVEAAMQTRPYSLFGATLATGGSINISRQGGALVGGDGLGAVYPPSGACDANGGGDHQHNHEPRPLRTAKGCF